MAIPVMRPAKAGIQFAATSPFDRKHQGVLDHPAPRVMTGESIRLTYRIIPATRSEA